MDSPCIHPVSHFIDRLAVTDRRYAQPFTFRQLQAESELNAAYRLRYQVYCLERGFQPPEDFADRIDANEFDNHALRFGAFDREGEIVGTVRLVFGRRLPALEHLTLWAPLPLSTAEVSRLAVSRRVHRCSDRVQIVIGLYKVMFEAAQRSRVTHFLAGMARSMAVLLERKGFNFRSVGPETDYHGIRAPYLAALAELKLPLERALIRASMPPLFHRTKPPGRDQSLEGVAVVTH